jgi:hypothetical protein
MEASRMAWAISRNNPISCPVEPSGLALTRRCNASLLPHHADAARDALAAGFVAEETGDPQQDLAKINRVIKQHDYARS